MLRHLVNPLPPRELLSKTTQVITPPLREQRAPRARPRARPRGSARRPSCGSATSGLSQNWRFPWREMWRGCGVGPRRCRAALGALREPLRGAGRRLGSSEGAAPPHRTHLLGRRSYCGALSEAACRGMQGKRLARKDLGTAGAVSLSNWSRPTTRAELRPSCSPFRLPRPRP